MKLDEWELREIQKKAHGGGDRARLKREWLGRKALARWAELDRRLGDGEGATRERLDLIGHIQAAGFAVPVPEATIAVMQQRLATAS